MTITIPDAGILKYRLEEVKQQRPQDVYICKVVLDRLHNETSDGNPGVRKQATQAVDYIQAAKLNIVPDPTEETLILLGLDNQHEDDLIIASYFEIWLKEKKQVRLHLSNERTAAKAKRAEEALKKFKNGDYTNIENAQEEYQPNRQMKKRFIPSGRTGLAKTEEVKERLASEKEKAFAITHLGDTIKRSLISIVALVGLFLLLSSNPNSEKEAAGTQETSYEINKLAFENIEVTLKEVDDREEVAVLQYEMINRNEDPIEFGYYNEENPIDGKKRDSVFKIDGPSYKVRFKEDIIDYEYGGRTLEPNQIIEVSITIDGPLKNFLGFDTYMQNETTGEIREWSFNVQETPSQ